MSDKKEKQYNHYVPQFYLKNFSYDGKSIVTYIFKHKKYIDCASIDRIGGKNHLYGDTLEIENMFCKLEDKWAPILKKIINNNSLNISDEEYAYVLIFVYLSDARSLSSANDFNRFINDLAITTANMEGKKISYKEKAAEFTIPNYYPILITEKMMPLLMDLKMSLILNKTNVDFITSDCFVNKYNQFLIEKNFYNGCGYAVKGFMAFVPISPKHCLILYDKDIYKTKDIKNTIEIKDFKEINRINKMIIYNAEDYLFFSKQIDKERCRVLLKNMKRFKIDNNTVFKSDDEEFLLKMTNRGINHNFYLKFMKVKSNLKVDIKRGIPPLREVGKMFEEHDYLPIEVIDKINNKEFYPIIKE